MLGKRICNFIAGLLFVGIFGLNSVAFGSLSYDHTGLSSEKEAGCAQIPSQVVFIDPSVPEIEKIVAQLPQGTEVVRLSPEMDGIAQISAHLAKRMDLSAIHIISHGNAGHFVLNGTRIDGNFLRDNGDRINLWGRSLAENGDILLYGCNLAATDEGKAFVKRFVDLTDADVAASTDVTGGQTFNGDWSLEYSMGRIDSIAITVDPNIDIKLACTWTGAQNNSWNDYRNWSGGSSECTGGGSTDPLPGDGDDVVISTQIEGNNPDMNISTTFATFTINSGKTLNIVTNGAIKTTGIVTINGTVNADGSAPIEISQQSSQISLNGSITSDTGSVSLGTGDSQGIVLTGDSTITSTGGTVTFQDTINGAFALGINAGTGSIDFEQEIGGATNLTTLTISQSGGTIFEGNVSTSESVVLSDTTDGANITFTGALETPTLTTAAEPYNLDLHGDGTTITNAVTFANTGTLALGDAANDQLLFHRVLTATAPSGVTLNGQVRTSGDAIIIGDSDTGVTLAGDATLDTTISEGAESANVTLGGAVNGMADNTQSLTLNAGTGGTISVTGAIGETADKQIKTLTITNSNGTTFSAAVMADTSVILTETTDNANITFTGTLVTPTLTTAAEPYNLDLHGDGTTITNAVTFTHAGALVLGNAADDTLLFNGGLTATAPSGVTLNGQVRTSGDTISIGDAGTGVTLAGTTSVLDTTNNGGTDTGADISVGGTVDGATANTQGLTVNGGTGGTATFSGHIGGEAEIPLDTLTLTNGNLATGGNNITGSGITVNGGTFNSASSAGTWDLSGGVTIASGATLNATSGLFTVGGDWSNSGTFTSGSNTVTFDGTSSITSGGTGDTNDFHHVTLNGTSATLSTNAIDINGNFTITSGTWDASGLAMSVAGNWSNSGTFSANNNTVTMDGSNAQTIGGSSTFNNLTIANTHASNYVDASGSTLAVSNILNITDGKFKSASDYEDVTIGAAGTLELSGNITVSGDWSNSGTFTPGTHMVTLDGTGQTLSGATSFYQLTKNVNDAADTLTFTSGTANRTTITNALDLKGKSGKLLSLISSSPDEIQWEIDPQGTRTIAYLDVKDSNNVDEETAINAVGTNSVDSGNNTNWTFATPTITSFSPTSGGTNTSVTITGTNFTGTEVKFGGTAASSFTVDSSTQITAVVAGGSTGKVTVATSEGTATSSGDFTYTTVTAGTYYVNIASGNDTNDGSSTNPWKTLHYAISQINGGPAGTYVLYVALGTYSKSKGEQDAQLVLSQSSVTIKGEDGSAPIIDGTNAQTWTRGLEITGSDVTLVNLYVTGFSDTDEEGIRISGGTGNEIRYCNAYSNNWGIRVNEATNTTIKNCDIYSNSTHGIDVVQSTGTTVTTNKIHGNPQYGIRLESSSEISRNVIYDNQYGIYVDVINSTTVAPTIKNNVIYEITSDAMSYGIFTRSNNESAVNPKIYHNTIDGGKLDGIKMEKDGTSSSAPIIKYNNITSFGQYGIQNSGASPTIEYNDVWDNTAGSYSGGTLSSTNKNVNPQYVDATNIEYSLQSDSECINAIPSGDPVTLDYPGFIRPRPGETAKDMGAYEYVAKETNSYTLPGGSGVATDYRIFTVPLNLETGLNMLREMEKVLGSYDPVHWRAFMYNGTSYTEFSSNQFSSHKIVPGMGFWIITTYTDTVPFDGTPAPDGVDYVMELSPGWHLIGLPWTSTRILLSSIKVTDGVNTYAVSSSSNDLTQRKLWDYTGVDGYVARTAASFRLQDNKGYFFKVNDNPVRMIIPNAANVAQEPPEDVAPNRSNRKEDDEAPPPPPGAEPSPDIKVNGEDGPVTVSAGDSVSVSVSLDPGVWEGYSADWWVAAHTPFDYPLDWYTYVYPEGWQYGIHVCAQTPLYELTTPYNVLNTVLPAGSYIFYFAVDGNMDGVTDATWLDFVEVLVE